ncbi:MAG: HD domain-containing protein [Deltaproteobacteria bacterium]|jgi:(p)ppGpp synthase/HD superfamily hydrolase|nr:HD domain-containing protein [Deltaproteobacteria bacterium]
MTKPAAAIPPGDLRHIQKSAACRRQAWLLAAERHREQLYPGTNLPYLTHIGSVVLALQPGLDANPAARADLAVLCAILHDTVEDTNTTVEELESAFGPDVAAGVAALTKDPALKGPEAMADSLRRILKNPPEIAMVKLADRIANLGVPATHWTPKKCHSYAQEGQLILNQLGGASLVLSSLLEERINAWLALEA